MFYTKQQGLGINRGVASMFGRDANKIEMADYTITPIFYRRGMAMTSTEVLRSAKEILRAKRKGDSLTDIERRTVRYAIRLHRQIDQLPNQNVMDLDFPRIKNKFE